MRDDNIIDKMIKRLKDTPPIFGQRIGACIDGDFFSRNQAKSHPLQQKLSFIPEKMFLHAEVGSIIKALNKETNFRRAAIYVARINANGNLVNAYPCPSCMDAISKCGFKRIVYTSNEGTKCQQLNSLHTELFEMKRLEWVRF